jgi:hypothetical protein
VNALASVLPARIGVVYDDNEKTHNDFILKGLRIIDNVVVGIIVVHESQQVHPYMEIRLLENGVYRLHTGSVLSYTDEFRLKDIEDGAVNTLDL